MLRVLSLFSGIGAFEVALDEENIEWELDHYCEIDKYACQSYNCIHGTTDEDNLKDVTNIDYSKIGNVDLVTYGFPCQDISLAGKGKGFFDEEGNLTRSGLFFNAADVIRHTNPKFAIFENVKNLTGKKFKNEFETVLSTLDELGYNTYWKVLNAKDYGVPQNRERVFGISIRKDIDHGYEFPLPVELTLRLKDMLETQVDEKYYLSEKMFNYAFNIEKDAKGVGFSDAVDKSFINPNISNTLSTKSLGGHSKRSGTSTYVCEHYDKCIRVSEMKKNIEPKVQQVGNIVHTGNWDNPQRGRIYSSDGISPTLNCMQGGGLEPKIIEKMIQENNKNAKHQQDLLQHEDDICRCIPAGTHGSTPHLLKTVVRVKEATKKKYDEFIEKNGYVPEMFNPYNCAEITDVEPTQSTQCGGTTSSATVLKREQVICRSVVEPLLYPCMNKHGYKLAHDGDGIVTSRPHQARSTVMNQCSFAIRAQNAGDSGVCLLQENQYRIRKLTPRECWRLMGFKDYYFNKVKGVSNTQLYKQAGNSIVVDVLRAIFRELHEQYPEHFVKYEWGDDL